MEVADILSDLIDEKDWDESGSSQPRGLHRSDFVSSVGQHMKTTNGVPITSPKRTLSYEILNPERRRKAPSRTLAALPIIGRS
ncbi:hypothetical protein PAAG_12417 [Paracoccidioides lutzii Pb01]|uniref:Uncharacterized protein n=1 Tax=Paracoccidioides lutzii (strain ATCC MYA-826 / Pb01) TaxID=502779 RepID=A0A0A2VJ22_PARBA|nr:hypothetical protein PAAG_12417 [Paracoccidioides lutzii Pb01]KGQ00914.1 hypothetical protein PAAG_12417 [Paracoccidioides lutzii Pb01]